MSWRKSMAALTPAAAKVAARSRNSRLVILPWA
jgi:hypothetical protein